MTFPALSSDSFLRSRCARCGRRYPRFTAGFCKKRSCTWPSWLRAIPTAWSPEGSHSRQDSSLVSTFPHDDIRNKCWLQRNNHTEYWLPKSYGCLYPRPASPGSAISSLIFADTTDVRDLWLALCVCSDDLLTDMTTNRQQPAQKVLRGIEEEPLPFNTHACAETSGNSSRSKSSAKSLKLSKRQKWFSILSGAGFVHVRSAIIHEVSQVPDLERKLSKWEQPSECTTGIKCFYV